MLRNSLRIASFSALSSLFLIGCTVTVQPLDTEQIQTERELQPGEQLWCPDGADSCEIVPQY